MQITQGTIPVGKLIKGRNPRVYFDPVEMEELKSTVREAGGILQPILVRYVDDGLQLVAGERRCRAAFDVLGEEYSIPYMAREMTDAEVDNYALIENIQRSKMAPTEEAAASARILANCHGDRNEAARQLGWSRSTLDSRLALMNCSEAVQKALNERKIDLGHAELLASVSREKQDQALAGIFEKKVSVADLKQMLARIAKSMSVAIFDKKDCTNCQHNSDNQSVLFSESIGSGSCTNGGCYDAKTEAELQIRRDALAEDYPRVEIVRPGDNFKIIKLVAEGPKGVGDEQAKACKGCANFGAAISAVPDKLGKAYPDQCFDIACNSQKVAARITAEKEEQAAAQAQKPVANGEPKTKLATSAGKKTESAKKPAPTVQDSTRLKEYRAKVWRLVTKKELMAHKDVNLAVLIGLCLAGEIRHVSSTKFSEGFGKLTQQVDSSFVADLPKALDAASDLSEEHRQTMIMGIAASAMDSIEERNLIKTMKFIKVDLAKHWKLNKEFLGLLTKSEMEALADEIGLKAALGEKLPKLMKQKNEEIIKALLAVEGFEYAGKLPRSMQYDKA
jgi:ParB family chromosome partitioning protein